MPERESIEAYLLERWRAVRGDLDMIERLLQDVQQAERSSDEAEPPAPAASTEAQSQATTGTVDVEPALVRIEASAEAPRFQQGVGRYGKSVRLMVAEVLQSEDRWFTPAEVFDRVVALVGDQAADSKLKNNVRTGLYTLKKYNEAKSDGNGRYRHVPESSGDRSNDAAHRADQVTLDDAASDDRES